MKEKTDPVIQLVIGLAKDFSEIKEVIFFGSRKRGDARENSDYDFAVISNTINHANWSIFCDRVREQNLTLHKIDLLDFSSLDSDFKKRILSEGVKIYERP